MARCEICGREMLTAKTCVGAHVEIEGKEYKRIRFGDPNDRMSGYLDPNATCGDCRCHIGGLHHWGCDRETCPKCGHQLISCCCNDVYLLK